VFVLCDEVVEFLGDVRANTLEFWQELFGEHVDVRNWASILVKRDAPFGWGAAEVRGLGSEYQCRQ
jgi:hypothetical protein